MVLNGIFIFYFFLKEKQNEQLRHLLSSKYCIFWLVKKKSCLHSVKNVLQKGKNVFTENEIHRTKRDSFISQVSKHLIKKEKNQDCMTESFWVSGDGELLGQ